MRRWIVFWLSVAMIFYVGIIYNSESMIFLGFILLVIILLLLLHNLFLIGKRHIYLRAPLLAVEENQILPLEMIVENRSILPVGRVRVRLQLVYQTVEMKQKIVFQTTVPGRKCFRGNGRNGSASICWKMKAKYTGSVACSIQKASVFDLLGILPLPLKRRSFRSTEKMVVLPAQKLLSSDFGELTQRCLQEQGSENRFSGEKNPPDVMEIREYQPGDRLGSIHWKLSAKKGDWMVSEYASEPDCQVVFYLDPGVERDSRRRGKRLRKKEIQRRREYLEIFYAAAMELLQQQCNFHLIYFDEKRQDLCRFFIKKEEDLQEFFYHFYFWKKQREFDEIDLEEMVQEKYRQSKYAIRLVLYRDLRCLCNGEVLKIKDH